MPDIKDSVGDGGVNRPHDVAMLQALLQVVKNAKGHPYLPSNYDGNYTNATKIAITTFQKDQKIIKVPQIGQPIKKAAVFEKAGFAAPGGPTIQKLNAAMLPVYKDLRIIEDTRTVYWHGSATDAQNSAKAIRSNNGLEQSFRENVAKLVDLMHQRHGIVLSLPKTGGLRTFQEQYNLATQPNPPTGAGPGESNHNFGLAVDIGFHNFKWLGSYASAKTETYWLEGLAKASATKAKEMWTARDKIAFSELGMFESARKGDYIHVQKFSDANVSMSRSLAFLLTQVGTMKWQFGGGAYQCDLALGKQFVPVGNAERVWDGNVPLTKQVLETAYKAAGKGGAVTEQDVKDMKRRLRADFDRAESKRFQWAPKA